MKRICLSIIMMLFLALGACAKDIIPVNTSLDGVRTVGLY